MIVENKSFYPLIITESDETIKVYKKIFANLKVPLQEIISASDYIDCLYNKNSISIVSRRNIGKLNGYSLDHSLSLKLTKNETHDMNEIIHTLSEFWYTYSEYSAPGSYKKIGDLMMIRSFSGEKEYILNFWGNVIDSFQEKTYKDDFLISEESKDQIYFWSKKSLPEWSDDFFEILKREQIWVVLDMIELAPEYEYITSLLEKFICFEMIPHRKLAHTDIGIKSIDCHDIDTFKILLQKEKTKIIYTRNTNLIHNFIEYNNIQSTLVREVSSWVYKSFSSPDIEVICDDVIQKVFIKKRVKRNLGREVDLLLKIKQGDYIVHIDHGIGLYKGIIEKTLGKITKEYLEIHYRDNDILFVPISEVERVSKYVWVDTPELTSLSGKMWAKKLEKVDKEVERIAQELLEIYAKREISIGHSCVYFEDKIQAFQNEFPYTYTESQTRVLDEIIKDMCSKKNMDRILIGDVGFWKTEVAFNALFHAWLNKKQAILISPLVVLAYEHFSKARERFAKFWLKFDILTRLENQKHTTDVIKKLASGELDFVIGTHKVFSDKISYKNLGLVVIDEEHKFGVEDKEKIKKLKTNVDCLSMSATPIPRTLNLALSGIRDISLLKEAPVGRKDIISTVAKFDENLIKEAGEREFDRGGQIFFIHNRVENIHVIAQKLSGLFPSRKIAITHGQLSGDELEDRIIDFKEKKYDILLSTTVIENGIDFSNVNTIFINECQSFGLSQIHQLRGRVGRSDVQGYCYLLYRKEIMWDETTKRLKTIVKYSYLGAGFELAIKDLELRGWGDILWVKQSGQATEIGINLYIELLEKKIEELKQGEDYVKKQNSATIDLQISAYIPDDYFNGESDKLNFYKEIEFVETIEELREIRESFEAINPDFPTETQNLFDLLLLKLIARDYRIISIRWVGINYQIEFSSNIRVEELKKFLELDKDVFFHIVSLDKIRTLKSNFLWDIHFLQYLLGIFLWNSQKVGKIRLVSKS
jgi:transcription-repair coupling factor